MQDGQPAHARVEDADRPRVHPQDCRSSAGPIPFAVVRKGSRQPRAAAALVLAAGAGPAASAFDGKQSLTLPMDDGVSLARDALPAGRRACRPAAGRRSSCSTASAATRADERARRRGTFAERGLRSPHLRRARPRRVRRPRRRSTARGRSPTREALFDWLAARPDIADAKIGAWGISYGGGASGARSSRASRGRRSRRARRGPTSTPRSCRRTWPSRARSPVPGSSPGDVGALAVHQLAQGRRAREHEPRRPARVGRARSMLPQLGSVKTPRSSCQGRRDFAFGIEQGIAAYAS